MTGRSRTEPDRTLRAVSAEGTEAHAPASGSVTSGAKRLATGVASGTPGAASPGTPRTGPKAPVTGLRLRTPAPAAVLAYHIPAMYQRDLQAALAGHVTVEFTSSWRTCQERLLERAGLTLLVAIPAARQGELLEQLVSMRDRFPNVPMVGVFIEGTSDFNATAQLGARGVARVIPSSRVGAANAVLEALSHSETEGVAARVWRLAHLDVNDACATLLRTTLRLAHEPVTLPQLARAARMHERTLRKYCEHNGLPSPQHIIGWARCLMVAYYLEEEGRSIQSIAGLLQFATPALMSNHIRRYTRQTPRDLRAYGAVRVVARMLEAQIIKSTIPEIPRARSVGESAEAIPRPRLRLI